MTASLRRRLGPAVLLAATAVVTGCGAASHPQVATPVASTVSSRAASALPAARHVFVINIENTGFAHTWGSASQAPYLARTLRAKGVLLSHYYGTAHHSAGNYLAQVSGQGPDTAIQGDCATYASFHRTGSASPGQVRGSGCVFPAGTPTLMRQLDGAGRTWRGYQESMPHACTHPALNAKDPWARSSATNEYATKHDPFVYFHDVIDRPSYCASHVVGLGSLTTDLRSASTTPNLAYITPNLCNDGHDATCGNGARGGLPAVNRWMKVWVPRILASPAFKADGVLVITADESDSPSSDSTACCGEQAANTTPVDKAGIDGPGGGRIGALVLSPYTRGGTTSTVAYNHYSLLGSIESLFGLGRIGYAQTVPRVFGSDVFNR